MWWQAVSHFPTAKLDNTIGCVKQRHIPLSVTSRIPQLQRRLCHRQSGHTAYMYRLSLHPQTLTCKKTAIRRHSLPFNGLHPRNQYNTCIYQPRRDGRLRWPGWLTHSGHFTHFNHNIRHRSVKVLHPRTDVLTTKPRCQPVHQHKTGMMGTFNIILGSHSLHSLAWHELNMQLKCGLWSL